MGEPTRSTLDPAPGPAPGARPPLSWRTLLSWKSGGLILLLGLAIRESLCFWTGHPYDFEIWIRTGYVVAHGTNPYLHPWPAVPGVSFGYVNEPLPSAAYLPFWPGIFGATYWAWEQVGGGNRFVLYLLLKQGPIAGDVLTALLLYRLVFRATGDRGRAVAALAFWSLFPYDIVIGSVWGQLDPVTTAIVLASLLVTELEAARRSVLWGVGIFVKWVTAVFLPLEFFRLRGWRRVYPFLAVVLAGALTVTVVIGLGWGFGNLLATATSQSAGGGGGMNYARLFGLSFVAPILTGPTLLGEVLPLLWVPGVVIAGWIGYRWARSGGPGQELRAVLFVTVIWLLLRWGLNEQYFLYPFSLLVVDIYAFHPGRRQFLYYLILVASAYLLWNGGFGIWFAAPANPAAFNMVQVFDNSPFWGPIRNDILYALAVLITVSLVQFARAVYRDEPAPRPWLYRLWPRRSRPRPSLLDVSGDR